MKNFTKCLAACAAIAGLSAPVGAQNTYGYQQTYPQQSYPGYGQQGYGYNQGYGQNPIGQVIDQLLGNRYNVTDRQAVSQCASAAMAQAAAQYGNGYNNAYGQQRYGGENRYRQRYGSAMRVTAITDVQRRSNGLRVAGLMGSGGRGAGQYGYQNGGYAGDVSFRCNVDYRGQVTNIRIGRNNGYRG